MSEQRDEHDGPTKLPAGLRLTRVDPDELPAYLRAVERAFGEDLSDEVLASFLEVAEPARFLAVRDELDAIVGTAGSYTFDVAVPGGATAGCAGVTVVGVRQDHRRRGLLTAMMRQLLYDARDRQEPFVSLWASEGAIYGRYGFGTAIPLQELQVPRDRLRFRAGSAGRVSGASSVGERGELPVDAVEVVSAEQALARFPAIFEQARQRRAGMLSRRGGWWRHLVAHDPRDERDEGGPRTLAVLEDRGYVSFRLKPRWDDGLPAGTVAVEELTAIDPQAEATLWRFVATTDLAAHILAPARPLDDPLPAMLVDPMQVRARRFPPVYLRLVDVAAALTTRRYDLLAGDDAPDRSAELTLEVADPTLPDQAGRYHLEVAGGAGRCERTDGQPDLVMGTEELATVYLGGVSVRTLVAAGRVDERSPGAADRLTRLLATPRAPWQPSEF